MLPWINYHHLYYFKTIAEEGSVLKAADKLRLGQPTLSAQLKTFEDTLGIKLFERKNKRLILTDQGKVALEYARQIFRLGSEMYEVLQDRLVPLKPKLHIGSLDSVPKHMILELVKMAQKFSACHITLSEGKSEQLIQGLVEHKIDLVLSSYLPMGDLSQQIDYRLLSRKTVTFYASPKYKSLKKKFPQSLSGQPLIVPTYDSKLRQDLDHWGKTHKIELNIIVESQDVSVKKMAALQGLGIIATAEHTVHQLVNTGELIALGPCEDVFEELYLLTSPRQMENALALKLKKEFMT
jgi:LysR family transcriptional activator of nhaA